MGAGPAPGSVSLGRPPDRLHDVRRAVSPARSRSRTSVPARPLRAADPSPWPADRSRDRVVFAQVGHQCRQHHRRLRGHELLTSLHDQPEQMPHRGSLVSALEVEGTAAGPPDQRRVEFCVRGGSAAAWLVRRESRARLSPTRPTHCPRGHNQAYAPPCADRWCVRKRTASAQSATIASARAAGTRERSGHREITGGALGAAATGHRPATGSAARSRRAHCIRRPRPVHRFSEALRAATPSTPSDDPPPTSSPPRPG